MKLLPCLRWSRNRWWLPLEAATAECLAAILLEGATKAPQRVHLDAVRSRMHCDPALSFLFAVLRYGEYVRGEDGPDKRGQRRPADVLSIDRLASWFVKQAPRLFSQPERQMGAPQVSEADRQAWSELAAGCLDLPIEDWLAIAPHWLAVKGQRVPISWQATWPRIRPPQATKSADPNARPLCYATDSLSLTRVAELVQTEQQLRDAFDQRLQIEKLASLKQFAYGLTHEINNPLANIVTRSEQLQAGEHDPRRIDSLQRIIDQAMRAHEMISDVMFFAHPPRPEKSKFELESVIADVLSAYQSRCVEQSISLSADEVLGGPLLCFADRSMLHDAVDALVRNACEAIGCGGKIVVRTGCRDNKVWVSVSDSGSGLSEEARRHAFDPYFSGREAGRGLGLGLCRVYRIAKLHRGGASISGAVAGCIARFWIVNK